MEKLIEILSTSGLRLLGGIAELVLGFVAVHYIMKLVEKSKGFAKLEPTLKSFVHNTIRLILSCIVILTAVGIMGVPMTSVVTLLASAGVAISLAVQGVLSNLVGGLMLLFLKPIKAGEYVKVGDIEGTVRSIGTFYTEMVMPDNRFISVPNSNLTNTAIINFTRQGTRRLDVTRDPCRYRPATSWPKARLPRMAMQARLAWNSCEMEMPTGFPIAWGFR